MARKRQMKAQAPEATPTKSAARKKLHQSAQKRPKR